MSKPTIGWTDAVRFGMFLTAGFTHIGAHVLETDVRLNYNPMQHTQEYTGNDNPAFLAIRDTNDLAREAQRLEELQQITKGEVAKEDRTAENEELAKGLNEIAEGLEQPDEAHKKRDEQQREMDEGSARNAYEANLPAEIRIAEAGQQLADKIRESGELAIAGIGDHSDRTPEGIRQQAESEAKKIESQTEQMLKSNERFQDRIKNEPVERQNELMADRVNQQEKILTEKSEAAITGLSRSEPVLEFKPREI